MAHVRSPAHHVAPGLDAQSSHVVCRRASRAVLLVTSPSLLLMYLSPASCSLSPLYLSPVLLYLVSSCPALVSVSLSLSLSPHFLSCSLRCCCTDSPLPLSSIFPAPSLLLSSQSLSVARTRDTPAPHLSPDLLCHGSLPRLPSPHAAAAAPGRQPLLVPCCLRQPGLRCCEYPAFLPSCS